MTRQHSRNVSVTSLLQQLAWRSLQERRLVARLTMLFKALDNKAAVQIPEDFGPSSRTTRSSHGSQHLLPHTRTDTFKYSYFPRTIKTWNILPAQNVYAPDADAFKARLQDLFTSGHIWVVPPRGQYHRPRYGSTVAAGVVGPVY